MKRKNEPLTNEQIEQAFEGTNFGGGCHRKILEDGVLQHVCGFSTGHTLFCIMRDLGLINASGHNLRNRGRVFLAEKFYK